MANQVHGARSLGQRDTQEDAYRLVLQSEKDPKTDILMLVADGMGGHVGGEIASNLALKVFERHFISGSKAPKPSDRLREALVKSNEALASRIKEEPTLKGMGCTLIGVLKLGDRIVWVSVGDSLIYLYRGGQLRRLNADHSLMAELMEAVNAGKMSLEEAQSHPRRNALRSAVIGEPLKLIDSNGIGLETGDVLIIATDGLDTLSPEALSDALHRNQKGSVEAIAEGLLDQVERAGKPNQDNTTVVAYRHGVEGHSSLYKDSKWKIGGAPDSSEAPAKGGFGTLLIGMAAGLGLAALALMIYFISRPEPVPEPVVMETDEPVVVEPETPPLITIEPGPQEIGGGDAPETDPTPEGGLVPFDPNAPLEGGATTPDEGIAPDGATGPEGTAPADPAGGEDGTAPDAGASGQQDAEPETIPNAPQGNTPDGTPDTTGTPEGTPSGGGAAQGDAAVQPPAPPSPDTSVTEQTAPPARTLPQVGDGN
ncbi:MAG: protein phosphatase 2C domain-containing protein [Pseudomonadota bacterium]